MGERSNNDFTMLHWAAQGGKCDVARYLIEKVKMDPQDRTEVCGMEWEEVCPKYRLCLC